MGIREFERNLLVGGDMSGSITSPAQNLDQMTMCCIQAVFTGSPVGSLKLQISNDNVTYSDYTGSSVNINSSGNFLWNMVATGFAWVRVIYTVSSGTGSLNLTVVPKGP